MCVRQRKHMLVRCPLNGKQDNISIYFSIQIIPQEYEIYIKVRIYKFINLIIFLFKYVF